MSVKSITIITLNLLFLCAIVLKQEYPRLQERRQYELAKVEEKLRGSYVPAAIPETPGLVTGLVRRSLYSETKPSIVIGDNRKILYEENTIHGITIVKIHKDKAEFAKNGQRWTQKVGETPGPEWHQ